MPFIPLTESFPRVSRGEQAARDAQVEDLLRTEFEQDMPDESRDALEREYQQRFGKPAPVQRGFTPLAEAQTPNGQGFVPLEDSPPSVLKTIALNNPITALGEAALNLGSQMVALPAAGLAGIGASVGNTLGLTDKTGADAVHAVGEALTYQPRGEFGKAAAGMVAAPFEKLAEVGQGAGNRVLDATGSPVLATIADTAINAAPMAIEPVRARLHRPMPVPETVIRQASADAALDAIPKAQSVDEAVSAFIASTDVPLDLPIPAITHPAPIIAPVVRTMPVQEMIAPPVLREHVIPRPIKTSERVYPADTPPPVPEAPPLPIEPLKTGDVGSYPEAQPLPIVPETMRSPDLGSVRGFVPLATEDLIKVERSPAPVPAEPTQISVGRPVEAFPEQYARPREQPVTDIPAKGVTPGYTLVEAPKALDAILAEAQGKTVTRQARIVETGEMVELKGQNAAEAIESISKEMEALEALKLCAKSGGLRNCLRTMTESGELSEPTASAIQAAAVDLAKEGRSPKKTERNAIRGALWELRVELRDIYNQLGIKPPAQPAKVEALAPREVSPIEAAPVEPVLPKAEALESRPTITEKPGNAPELPTDIPRGFVPLEPVQPMAGKVQNSWAPGANYAPMVDQMRPATSKAATVADLPEPLRREQIIKDFARAIDTTVYEGRVKGKATLGFFRPGVEEVRIKHAGDIEVTAHEIAHLIDHRVPEIQRAYLNDKALRDELRSVSYDQKNVKEGFAESVRLFLTQPETLETRAPKAHAWLTQFADSHAYGPALRQAQEQMVAWFGQDALNRARSKIGSDTPLSEYFNGFWDKFRQSTVDDLHGIYRMERDLTGKINPNGPYESARLSRASASIADGVVRFGYPEKAGDGSFKFTGKGLEDILKPVAESLEDALLYFVGRSAHELLLQKREHLFTKGEIDAMLKLKTPERMKAFQEYQQWNKGILDFAQAQGVINPESRRLWQRTQYMPFHRVDQPGGLKGKPGDWAGVQALTGGTTNIKDVLGNMIGNAAMLLDKAVKNEARLKVARLSQLSGGGKFMVKIDAESRPVKISGDQVLNEMFKRYGIAIDGDVPAFFEFLIKGQPPAGNNVVAVMREGKPVWFEVGDPILYRALKAIDRPVQSDVVRWLGLPKRLGQATITATPDFWMANIARDTLMGSVMSRAGFRPVIDSLKGMSSRMSRDPLYKDYLANGGGMSSFFLDEHHFRTKLEKFYRNQGIDYKTVLDTPDKLLSFVETLGDAFEMSTRLGEYGRAIEKGENPRHAAYMGRDVSTDFAMKGDSAALGFMYDTVMFLRPALVSWDRLYRGLKHDDNKGAIAVKAGAMALMSAGLYLLNKDDPRYQDLQDWDRDANWHFFIGDEHFRWPKIWEIGALSSAAERSVEKIISKDPQGLGKDFARIIGATFNLNVMPQILAPLVEQATNKNAFTKAPIETPGMENVQPFLRSKPGTSETMKAIGMATRDMPESLQVNPARAEALLRGYFNTYALYGLMLSDQALFGEQLPTKRTDELPVVRRFYSQEPAKHTKYETQFYEMLQEAKRLKGTMRELDDRGLTDYAYAKEKEPLATEAKPMERAQKTLMGYAKDMANVRKNPDLSPDEKRRQLDALSAERNAIFKAAVLDSNKAQKGKIDEH
jgi:hypothetical protein